MGGSECRIDYFSFGSTLRFRKNSTSASATVGHHLGCGLIAAGTWDAIGLMPGRDRILVCAQPPGPYQNPFLRPWN
jgi:hypothetical protein